MSSPKIDLRKSLLEKRKKLTRSQVKQRSAAACANLLEFLPASETILAGYLSVHREVDIVVALGHYQKMGNRVCLPVVSDAETMLVFKEWSEKSALVKAAFGVRIPAEGDHVVPEIVIVPLVGFDRRGQRIGYGKGYYDATLAALRAANPKLRAIGVAYDFQEVDTVPSAAYDVLLDVVVTDKEIIQCR